MNNEQAISLETGDCETISSFLHSAAAYFDEFAKQAANPPSHPGLVAQFEKQARQAREFAEKFSDCDFAHLIQRG